MGIEKTAKEFIHEKMFDFIHQAVLGVGGDGGCLILCRYDSYKDVGKELFSFLQSKPWGKHWEFHEMAESKDFPEHISIWDNQQGFTIASYDKELMKPQTIAFYECVVIYP